jgi:hypothetical protein
MSQRTISFSLDVPAAGPPLAIQLRHTGERWIANVGGGPVTAMAPSAGQALRAALLPLRDATARILLADLSLLEPSLDVLAEERAAGA